ncbi:MAG TPA: hypothetical protein VMT68_00565 [Caulobacteraceae bacterium]|nr:hypothetical protein [Caulobacteraceae bacterium]
MISIALNYTSNLGPEADVPALLAKLALRLKETPGLEEPLMVTAHQLTEYAGVGVDEWAVVWAVLQVPEAQAAAFEGGLGDELISIADQHFAELYPRHSIALSFELRPIGARRLTQRLHRAPPEADTY